MSQRVAVAVPSELIHPVFFPAGKISWDRNDEKTLNVSAPFIYEAAYYAGMASLKPWNDPKSSIPALLEEWGKLKGPLEELFSQRKKARAEGMMRQAAALFIEFLFWANGKPARLSPRIPYEELEYAPVNIAERLEFIIARLNLYHSSVQLTELFKEMEKINAKLSVLRNR